MRHSPSLPPRPPRRRIRIAAVAALSAVIAAESVWIAWYASTVRWTRPGSASHPARWTPPEPAAPADFVRADLPGVRQPPALTARAARLSGGAAVIGLSMGSRHRAYAVEALAPITRHVVNDLLDRVPVTVTYCARTGSVAVFTEPGGGRPLDVAVAGWVGPPEGGSLVLRAGAGRYRQDTGAALGGDADPPFPYARVEYERTTWGHWRQEHPDTDVYAGDLDAGGGEGPRGSPLPHRAPPADPGGDCRRHSTLSGRASRYTARAGITASSRFGVC